MKLCTATISIVFADGTKIVGRREIAAKIAAGIVRVTRHAYEQMIARDIYIKQVHDAIANGRVTKRWHDRDGERLEIVGTRFNGDLIKVIVKDGEIPKVITVCWPYENAKRTTRLKR